MMIGRAHSERGDSISMSPNETEGSLDRGAGTMTLASLVDVGAWNVELPNHTAGAPNPIVQPVDLGDHVGDALFGEVIDISDLIPSMLSPSAEATTPIIPAAEQVGTAEIGLADGGDALAVAGHAAALTILYDDDILASDGTIL